MVAYDPSAAVQSDIPASPELNASDIHVNYLVASPIIWHPDSAEASRENHIRGSTSLPQQMDRDTDIPFTSTPDPIPLSRDEAPTHVEEQSSPAPSTQHSAPTTTTNSTTHGNNKLFLLKKMMALKYKEGTSTADHVNSWETFRVSLINSAPQGIITLDLAKSGVLNEEVRRRSHGFTSQSEVLVTENRRRYRERDGKGRDKSRSKSRSRYKNLECHHCGKKGHIKKYCFKSKRENKGGGDKHDQNYEEKSERAIVTCEDLMVICDENLVNLACDETSWVIDTGASTHVTSMRDFFTSYTHGDFGVLRIGNDGLVPVTGMGDVSLVSNNGTRLILKDVRHAPDIRLNLISTGKLDDEGFCNTFSDGQWKLTKGSLVVARGKKSSNLYLMQALTSRDTVNVTVNDNSTELWHKRLSHMSEKGLNCLAKKNQLSGLKNATLKNFPHCLAGKQRRVSFSSCPPHRKSKLLELVHSDVCGPLKFGYRLYNQVQKKLMRSRDVVFIEDQTIDDIDNTEKDDSPDSGDLTNVNLVPLEPSPNPIQDDVHGVVNDDQHDIGGFDAPIDDVVTDQQQAPIAPPAVPLRRSSRDRRSSIRYSSDDYVLLTDEGEPEFYEEAMESECKDQWVEAMKDELQSLHDNHTFELVKLPKGKRALKNRWVYRLKQE
ncbi:hypothetical protein V6N11_075471 [Hibiscus sabdariffa]|uniref:CCHC-type domain-containing protein n=1 Tax=Hibiscus sabdariffa TaxID=183260 RepID=A0ABR2R6M7_9ROSI